MNKYDEAILLFSDFIKYCEKTKQDHDLKADKLALEALKQAKERENPQPLTLENISQMDGGAIWCQFIHDKDLRLGWHLIIAGDNPKNILIVRPRIASIHTLDINNYGKEWLAYDHEPKGKNL